MASSSVFVSSADLNANKCDYCNVTVRNSVMCKKCKLVYHPSWFNRALGAKNPVCQHEKDVPYENDSLMEISRSEFMALVSEIVKVETKSLTEQIQQLREEISKLTSKNVHLIRYLQPSLEVPVQPILDEKPVTYINKKANLSGKTPDTQSSGDTEEVKTNTTNVNEDANPSSKVHPWEQAKRRRNPKKNLVIGILETAAEIGGNSESNFSASKRVSKTNIHVTRVNPKVTVGTVKSYVQMKMDRQQDVNGNFECDILQLNSKYPESYSSFKVTVNSNLLSKVMDPTFWPSGVAVRRYYEPSTKKMTKKTENFYHKEGLRTET